MSINDYILKMKSISENLSVVGQYIPDEELIIYILGNLSQDYDFVVVNLTSRCANLTFQEVQFMIQSHELCLEQLQSAATIDLSNPTASAATFKWNFNSQSGFPPEFSNNCGGRGFGNPRGRGGRGDYNRPTSQLCGRQGHLAIRCYHRFDISFQGTRQQSQSSSSSPQALSNNQAFVASSATVNDSAWYLDSGACNHIIADLNTISQKVDYKDKEKLTVGNGQALPIFHVGSSLLLYNTSHNPLLLNHTLHVLAIAKNLLSVSQFTKDNDVILEFYSDFCFIKDKAMKRVMLQGRLSNSLYQNLVPPSTVSLHQSTVYPVCFTVSESRF
ncbi:hypothetical protein TorRG33x02_096470 [Trema orientale]|uniref:Retrovirus-related Pol polyprotein from transposon TNT 1-94-like beta-barrel domain-containing protein n=1 Tax=Trema orientale TaxID=63057 RepID=A0A2P5F9Z0_TREOI|nr:hypothetical protein TorRG33x02_096470 [Trema orientale]